MTKLDDPGGGAVFELTLSGELGPVLRAAVGPHVVQPPTRSTLIRVGATTERDVAELVNQLHHRGLSIESVHRVVE